MAGQKFLQFDPTIAAPKEVVATQAGGSGNENKIPSLDNSGKLDMTMMPTGVGADTVNAATSESLAAGDFVNVYEAAGAVTVRKADATTSGKEANGFVKAAFTHPTTAVIYRQGSNDQLSGLTPGKKYFLSTTPGQAVATAPSGSGNIVQNMGVAISATTISAFFTIDPIQLA